ncbi:hypothetical protein [Burkholderia sp. BCC1993]|nr:hypothetical protein [Burkholderia sp. BCC1993]
MKEEWNYTSDVLQLVQPPTLNMAAYERTNPVAVGRPAKVAAEVAF